jgi:plastocyanin
MKTHFLALGGVAVLALGGATVGALAGRSTAMKTTVTVTEREYRIQLSTRTIPGGLTVFVVHNAGRVAHAFSVSGRGVPARTTGLIQPGATKSLRVTLGGGTVTLWCPLGRHAAAGMKLSLSARGSVLPPIGVSTNSGMTTDDGYGY